VIKIKSYKISRRGLRGVFVSLPAVWVRDLDLKPGESLDFYRDRKDRLIIVPPAREAITTRRTA